MSGPPGLNVEKIISGGQTGADRAALDWAIAHGIAHGGWCPRGRLAEDGAIPPRYRLVETPSADYAQRTGWNVRDSDATIIFSLAPVLSGGSMLTRQLAVKLGRPCLHVHPGDADPCEIREFLIRRDVRVLNIAGPRASNEPAVGAFVLQMLEAAWRADPIA